MKKLLVLFSLLTLSLNVQAAGPALDLDSANNDLRDQASLQRGAELFTNYCMACHSVKYMRYNRIARDIGWTDAEVVDKMTFGQSRVVDHVMTRMPDGVGMDVFGTEIPDLSLMARLKGTDYIYTFLKSYHQDEAGNWNNAILKGTAMPNVLEGIKNHSSEEEYDQAVRDITNFLDYVGEPIKVQRWDLGWKVMLFLFVLFILTYLLKKEYWRDIQK